MKLNKLIAENFACYSNLEIDFTDFRSACIIASTNNNNDISNAAGKSTIFKILEFVLFNESEVNLDKIIRTGTDKCRCTLYFEENKQLYALSRSRDTKGSANIYIYQLNPGIDIPQRDLIPDKKEWKDISGRRNSDAEKTLSEIIKIKFKSFRNTVHFVQNDFAGIATLTPEKRKSVFKEVLDLSQFTKLEKIAKDKQSLINKEYDKNENLISLLEPSKIKYESYKNSIHKLNNEIFVLQYNVDILEKKYKLHKNLVTVTRNDLALLEQKKLESIKDSINLDKQLKIVVPQWEEAKRQLDENINQGKNLNKRIKELKEKKDSLSFTEDNIFENQLKELALDIAANKSQIDSCNKELQDLCQAPTLDSYQCDKCLQSVSEDQLEIVKQVHQNQKKSLKDKLKKLYEIKKEKEEAEKYIQNKRKENFHSLKEIDLLKNSITFSSNKLKELAAIFQSLKIKEAESLKLKNDLLSQKEDLGIVNSQELDKQIESIAAKLAQFIQEEAEIANQLAEKTKPLQEKNNTVKVQKELFNAAENDVQKLEKAIVLFEDLKEKKRLYQYVVEQFSSKGLPRLRIQNILDQFQLNANTWLKKLKPELQIKLITSKEKDSGETQDVLDIIYLVNSQEREYPLLSGAQKIAVFFALKLGLSLIIQELLDIDMQFLLFDEIDQPFDKSSLNDFINIIHTLENDYHILLITHNDYLKDKFNHLIKVEMQDDVSTVKVISQ